MVTDAYLGAAATVAPLLRSPALAERWQDPSVLAGFGVSGLAGHLARGVFTVEKYLATPPPVDAEPIDAVAYFAAIGDDDSEANRQVRARGELDAGDGPADLADRYDAALARLAAALPALPADRPVAMVGGNVLPLAQCLVTRLVELLVHADDLAASLGVPTPEFPDDAADLVAAALVRLARRRHGTPAVLRALARRERATGPIAAF